jgi:hypothetical protein
VEFSAWSCILVIYCNAFAFNSIIIVTDANVIMINLFHRIEFATARRGPLPHCPVAVVWLSITEWDLTEDTVLTKKKCLG